jgi:GT2 family glycosyltransferase
MPPTPSLTIGLPTFGREAILIQTLDRILALRDPARMEVVVADQTPVHEPDTQRRLEQWAAAGLIRWLRLPNPSLTGARNAIVQAAERDVVLFLDDDVLIPDHLFEAHLREYADPSVAAVTGQVYNCLDWRNPPGLDDPRRGTRRHSAVEQPGAANNISGGNHSVQVAVARSIGGYDPLFVGAALAEDMDFSQRLLRAGHRIRYNPEAWIIHLGYPTGGCAVRRDGAWPEWSHSASLALYAFRHGRRQKNFGSVLWMAFRHGPGRKEVVVRPWRWPAAWWGFARGVRFGYRHRRDWPAAPPEVRPP